MMNTCQQLAILGVPIDNASMDEAVEILDGYIQQRGFHQVATANVNFLMNAIKDGELLEILQSCSLVLPDGMPVVWASRLMGVPLKERVAGYHLVPRLVRLAAERNYGIFLLGADEKCSAGAAAWIERNHPEARMAGRYSPPFGPIETMNHDEILQRIDRAKPDILLVAFGNPKQEKWLAMHRRRLEVPVAIGVGGSLNLLAGQVKYTPRWMQDHGIEAIYRVWQEPGRLGGRYLADLCGALRYLTAQVVAANVQSRSGGPQRLSYFWREGVLVIKPEGRFMGALVQEFETLIKNLEAEKHPVMLDMSRTKSLGPDALAAMLGLNSAQRAACRGVSLTEVSLPVRLVLATSRLHGHFQIVPAIRCAENCEPYT